MANRQAILKFKKQFIDSQLSPLDITEEKRKDVESGAAIKRAFGELEKDLAEDAQPKLALAITLLAHDHVKQVTREIGKDESPLALYIQALAARRGGQLAEACRDFRKLEVQPFFYLIADEIRKDSYGAALYGNFPRLIKDGAYNPTPMTGVIQQVMMGGHANLAEVVVQVQRLEFAATFEYACGLGRQRIKKLLLESK